MTPLRRTVCTLALLAAPVATALLLESPAAEAAAALAETGDSGNAFSPNRALAANFVAAARAARGNDFAAAAKALAPQLAGAEPEASRARVVLGLLAAEKDRADEAQRLLAKGPGPLALEDLRLFALAEGAAGRGATSVAWAALEELLRAVPESPLRRASLLKLAELAFADSKVTDALAFIEQGRDPAGRKALTAVEREQFDSLAWKIGSATGNPAVQREAARRLLVDSPLAAARLEVAGALVAQPQGDWRTALSTADLLARAAALLQVAVPQGALTTLEAVPLTDRDFDWSLLRARALTAAQRGSEALTELSQAEAKHAAGDPLGRLELERAHAYWDVVAVRRGRPALPAAERTALRGEGLAALRRAAALATSPELEAVALRELYLELEAAGEIDATIELLHRLAKVAPGDVLGARPLWERGWREYQSGNWSGAVGYWSELRDLYPAISYARSAQYWSGRAYEKLGDRERSLATFADLTRADTADFYSRQASLRLAGAPPTAAPDRDAQREDWPTDREIERARWLSELGLDELAATELEHVAAAADARAVDALRGLILARSGAHRESLRELRKAFPRLATAHQETVPRAALELYYPRPYSDQVLRLAREQSLPPSLVFGIVHQESGFDPAAKSRSGARGLMQLMPSTGKEVARRLGMTFSTQRLFEPEYSLRLGTTYFRQMLGIFDNRVELALAGYNGGPGRIGRLWREQQSAGEIDRFLEGLSVVESRNYVKRILVLAESYRSLYSDLS